MLREFPRRKSSETRFDGVSQGGLRISIGGVSNGVQRHSVFVVSQVSYEILLFVVSWGVLRNSFVFVSPCSVKIEAKLNYCNMHVPYRFG